jgi:hypothetical protein
MLNYCETYGTHVSTAMTEGSSEDSDQEELSLTTRLVEFTRATSDYCVLADAFIHVVDSLPDGRETGNLFQPGNGLLFRRGREQDTFRWKPLSQGGNKVLSAEMTSNSVASDSGLTVTSKSPSEAEPELGGANRETQKTELECIAVVEDIESRRAK